MPHIQAVLHHIFCDGVDKSNNHWSFSLCVYDEGSKPVYILYDKTSSRVLVFPSNGVLVIRKQGITEAPQDGYSDSDRECLVKHSGADRSMDFVSLIMVSCPDYWFSLNRRFCTRAGRMT